MRNSLIMVLFFFSFNTTLSAQGQGCETCLYATVESTTATEAVVYAAWVGNGSSVIDTLPWLQEDTLTITCGEGVELGPDSSWAVSSTGDTLAVATWAVLETLVIDTVFQVTDNPDLAGQTETIYSDDCSAILIFYQYTPPNDDYTCNDIIPASSAEYRHEMDFPVGSGEITVDFRAWKIIDTLIIRAAGEVVFEEVIGTGSGATLQDNVIWDNGVITPFTGDSPIHGSGFVRVILDVEDNCDLQVIAQSNNNPWTNWLLYVHCCPDCYEPPPKVLTVDTTLCFSGSVKDVSIARDTSFSRLDYTAGGCDSITIFNVHVAKPTIEVIDTDSVSCHGFEDGVTRAVVQAESPAYQWNNGSQQQENLGLSAGRYQLTLTDRYGCTVTDSITVHQPPLLEGDIEGVEPNCYGQENGQLFLSPYGGTPPYRLDWWNGDSGTSVDSLVTGEYAVTITDRNDCETPISYFLDQPDSLIAEILFLEPTCVGIYDGELGADVTGGTMPYRYFWEDGDDAAWRYDLGTGLYQLTVVDNHGCMDSSLTVVRAEFDDQAFVPNAFSPNGDGVNDLLYPQSGPCVFKVLNFAVYDRWGESLYAVSNFQPNDETKGWDGSFRGEPLSPGNYIWHMEVEYFSGRREVLKGDVMILK